MVEIKKNLTPEEWRDWQIEEFEKVLIENLKEVENLKCCGNCGWYSEGYLACGVSKERKIASRSCNKWCWDGLNNEDRGRM